MYGNKVVGVIVSRNESINRFIKVFDGEIVIDFNVMRVWKYLLVFLS